MDKKKIGLYLTAFFDILGIIAIIERIFVAGFNFRIIMLVFMYVSLLIYTIKGYKKPHGNELRSLITRYESVIIALLTQWINDGTKYIILATAICGMLVAYTAGRLDHYKDNRIRMILILVLVAGSIIATAFYRGTNLNFFIFNTYLSPVYMWLTICVSYFTRYDEHIEAGKNIQ